MPNLSFEIRKAYSARKAEYKNRLWVLEPIDHLSRDIKTILTSDGRYIATIYDLKGIGLDGKYSVNSVNFMRKRYEEVILKGIWIASFFSLEDALEFCELEYIYNLF